MIKTKLWLLVLFFSCNCCAKELVLSAIENSTLTAPLTKKLKLHYQAIGVDISVTPMPAARAVAEISSGNFDGELFRIKEFASIHKDLVRIDIPLATLEGVVLSTKPGLNIKSLNDIQDATIGIRKGVLFSDLTTNGLNTVAVNSNHQLIGMLLKHRVDFVFMSKDNAKALINCHKFEGIYLYSVTQINVYHCLHKRHKATAQQLTNRLRQTKQIE